MFENLFLNGIYLLGTVITNLTKLFQIISRLSNVDTTCKIHQKTSKLTLTFLYTALIVDHITTSITNLKLSLRINLIIQFHLCQNLLELFQILNLICPISHCLNKKNINLNQNKNMINNPIKGKFRIYKVKTNNTKIFYSRFRIMVSLILV